MNKDFSKRYAIIICLLLALTTVSVYYRVYGFNFVNYDDPAYVAENPYVQQGLTTQSIRWAFTTNDAANWHPLTWLSLLTDYQLFGLNPCMFHLSNLLFHIAAALLLFIVLYKCTIALWPSAFVAAAFALHPMHVESVAWISERKDVLSTFLWMLTMLAYLYYAKRPRIRTYLLTVAIYALGLMAKPMLVTLPCVLLLLDYWPLQRLAPVQPAGSYPSRSLRFLLLEKIPLFAMAAAASVTTFIVQKTSGAVVAIQVFPLKVRIENAIVSCLAYITKMFWPVKLPVFYPHPHPNSTIPMWHILTAAAILLVLSAIAIYLARRHRYLITGWLWFIGTLVPVIGLVQVGKQAMANRYSYIPHIGLFIAIAWLARDIAIKKRYAKILCLFLAPAAIAGMMISTWHQVGYWQNSRTLFAHTLKITTNNYVAQNNLGIAIIDEDGPIEEAIEYFYETLRIEPNDIDANQNLAKAFNIQGKYDLAIKHCYAVLDKQPNNPKAYNFLGVALTNQGKLQEATDIFRKALEANPKDAHLHSNLGNIFYTQGELNEAIFELRIAVDLLPDAKTHTNLATALAITGRYDQAVNHYRHSIALEPQNAKTHFNLGNTLMEQEKVDEAISEFKQAVSIDPDHFQAHINLATVFQMLEKPADAVESLRHIVRLQPQRPEAHFALANALFASGKIEQAVGQYRETLKIDPNHARAAQALEQLSPKLP